MDIDEGKLRAYLDRSLGSAEQSEVEKQLAESAQATAALARLSQEHRAVAPYLAELSPRSGEQADASRAYRRIRSQISDPATQSVAAQMIERITEMMRQSFIKRHQLAITVLVVAAVVAVALSFAPVRAMAGSLLQIFRVQTVRVVPVDRDDMEALRNNPNLEELVDQLKPQVDVDDDSEPQKVDTFDEAEQLAGFQVAKIAALPEDAGDVSISVRLQKVVQLQLDKDLLEAVFDAAEIEINLPDSINDQPVIVTHPNSVVQEWHREGQEILEFSQMTSPAIEYPDGLDLDAFGVAGLQLLGKSKEEAETLGSTIDWANTMVLPLPNDSDTSVTDVSVNGTPGVVFVGSNSADEKAAIMWTRNGMSYFMKGQFSAEQMIDMAKSVN
jgi:anti-sigma factor RsiW